MNNIEILVKIKNDNNLTLLQIKELSGINTTSLRDFINQKQQFGAKSYKLLKEFFNKYDYDLNYETVNCSRLYGVGFCDISGLDENKKQTKCYETWKGMFRRCYSKQYQDKEPTYIGCEVAKEWWYFSEFKKWYDNNFYIINEERMELDKDILNKNNKIYSPENCIFVPKIINTLFTKSNSIRGDLPIGVQFDTTKIKEPFKVQCSYFDFNINKKKKITIGHYNTPEEAFESYKEFKENNIKRMADIYKDEIPTDLYIALYNYKVEITD